MSETPAGVNVDNEMVLISHLLYFEVSRRNILAQVKDTDFLVDSHRDISSVVRTLTTRAVTITKDLVISTASSLGKSQIEFEYLRQLEEGFKDEEENISEFVQILKLDRMKYDFKEDDLKSIVKTISRPGYNFESLKEQVYQTYLKLIQFETGNGENLLLDLDSVVDKYKEEVELREEGRGFYTTGFYNLDEAMTEAFAPKKITVIAARPGCGKSSLVYEIARRKTNLEDHVFVFSLEMEDVDIMDKYLSTLTGIPINTLVKGREHLTEVQKEKLDYELERYRNNKYLYICDKPGLSLDAIANQVRRKQMELGISYATVIIDLFGQISDFSASSGLAQQYEIKLDKVKQLTKELGIHSILVNQINRSAERSFAPPPTNNWQEEEEEDDTSINWSVFKNRPVMSQLKNSGKWEEIADMVLLLFRAKYYEERLQDDILEVIFAKQRKGEMNKSVYFEFLPERGRILPTQKLPYDMRKDTNQPMPVSGGEDLPGISLPGKSSGDIPLD